MASIRWSVGAGADLREVVEYIARDSATYAAAIAGRIVTAVEKLRHHPRLGRVVPEYQDPTIVAGFFYDIGLVNEADDPHLPLTLGTGKGIGFIDLSDEVGPAL